MPDKILLVDHVCLHVDFQPYHQQRPSLNFTAVRVEWLTLLRAIVISVFPEVRFPSPPMLPPLSFYWRVLDQRCLSSKHKLSRIENDVMSCGEFLEIVTSMADIPRDMG